MGVFLNPKDALWLEFCEQRWFPGGGGQGGSQEPGDRGPWGAFDSGCKGSHGNGLGRGITRRSCCFEKIPLAALFRVEEGYCVVPEGHHGLNWGGVSGGGRI